MLLVLAVSTALATTVVDSQCKDWGDFASQATVEHPAILELSGLAASQVNTGVLWGHNDSGGGTTVYAIGLDGSDLGTFSLKGAQNDDWEDIALGPCGDGCSCLYVADIGDHNAPRTGGTLWRVHEPDINDMPEKVEAEAIDFSYPSGAYDAEAIVVDPVTGDVFVIIRTEGDPATVYAFPSGVPEGDADPVTLTEVATLDLVAMGAEDPRVTAASVSPLGKQVIVRTDQDVYVYDVPDGGSVADVWDLDPERLGAPSDQDGEAVTFTSDGGSILLSSEGTTADLWLSTCEDTKDEAEGQALPLCEGEDGGCGCSGAGGREGAWGAWGAAALSLLTARGRPRRRTSTRG